jgi:hypothetical protein
MQVLDNRLAFVEVRRVTDPAALLPFEVSESTYMDDARHWADVYYELLQLNESIVQAVNGLVGRASNNTAMNALIDRRMRAYSDRCRERHAYWVRRGQELQAADACQRVPSLLSTVAASSVDVQLLGHLTNASLPVVVQTAVRSRARMPV